MNVLIDNRTNWLLTAEYEKLFNDVAKESLKEEGFNENCEISISLVDNAEIKEINRRFRHIDKETDVLSFPLLTFADGEKMELNENGEIILGDIIISVQKAVYQAEEYGHSLKREMAFLTAHSMLHLMGYDHMTDSEREIMFAKQEKILNNLGITRQGT